MIIIYQAKRGKILLSKQTFIIIKSLRLKIEQGRQHVIVLKILLICGRNGHISFLHSSSSRATPSIF